MVSCFFTLTKKIIKCLIFNILKFEKSAIYNIIHFIRNLKGKNTSTFLNVM